MFAFRMNIRQWYVKNFIVAYCYWKLTSYLITISKNYCDFKSTHAELNVTQFYTNFVIFISCQRHCYWETKKFWVQNLFIVAIVTYMVLTILDQRHWCGEINFSLRWRHTERLGVSNHQPLDLFYALFKLTSRKTSKVRVTGPLWGKFTGDRWIFLTKGQ